MISLRSKVTQKVLAFLFLYNEEFYARELSRRLDLPHSNLIKKLHELENLGMLTSNYRGQEKYYKLNNKFPLLREYKKIVNQSFGFEERLKETLLKTKGTEKAILFGSYVTKKMERYSDIDLLVIGSHSIITLQKNISKLQKEFKREINIINMSNIEFEQKRSKDAFLKRILSSPIIEVI